MASTDKGLEEIPECMCLFSHFISYDFTIIATLVRIEADLLSSL